MKLRLLHIAALPIASAFSPISTGNSIVSSANKNPVASFVSSPLFAQEDGKASDAVFLSPENEEVDEDVTFSKAEMLGRGAAKIKRGKRKGDESQSSKTAKPAAALTPEETFYEGPPAITETIIPTISILTVIGIIPAAAAWARQAWVRYKITSRRIRVTSGIGGNEMAEIVYPDIIEIRTVKRLFGDGDMVAFLRDGAKFEMRNIPNFEETIEFILKQVDAKVAATYRNKGDVTNP
mmetsp:Transcript_12904/g.24233  ORF Transcript_12904/g.24233 Transcript_12904/m.24233 type:complete len:237 (-) Transcript_12904:233-943(-)|eukprot:CAMPEP_0176495378 /NCGR_PEP_ID=MMETSP0200_2-20121128/10619_1 /TAXON_ID=947934 /ORGANISM="Chaetoceros sp., Strain GSL56" /LENGTH=236 /DNA_ID=CAMNT_0017893241 /DNA_START=93 /DNA_END=803 /DNA_ORIENTATION=-